MAYQYPEIRNFAGIFSQANSFTVPDGALEQAENVVISRDGVISKRRGFYQYYDPSTDEFSNVFLYQNRLVGVFSDKVAYFTDAGAAPNLTGTRTTLSGVTVAVTDPRVSRSVQTNNNLYFTTDNGVLKLESFSSSVYGAGTPPALDLRASFLPANGPISGESQVAWRVVFGRRDANSNLLLGSPSDITNLTNQKITGATYVRSGAGPWTVTVTSPVAHNLSTGMVVVTSAAVDTDANGTFTATVTSSTVFTYSVAVDPGASGSIAFAATRKTRLELSVPTEITSTTDGYFFQIYRTTQTNDSSVSPDADFKLIDEVILTSGEISASVAYYTDDTDDILLGAELYTNPNSREGELQANDRPPLTEDVTLFKNHVLYANCRTRHLLELQVVDPSSLAANDFVETKVGTVTRRYVARTGVGNQTVSATGTGTGTITITYASHGLATGDVIYASNITGTLAQGYYQVTVTGANTFTISATGLTATALEFQGIIDGASGKVTGSSWVRASNVVTVTSVAHGLSSGTEVSVTNSSGGSPNVASAVYSVTVTGPNTFTFAETGANDASGNTLDYAASTMFFLDNASSSASVKLRQTSQGLVKAVNRDASSLVYAKYASGLTDIPGKLLLQAKGFTDAIYMRANTTTAGGAFNPILPASFASGTQVFSRNESLPNFFYSSKLGEPEAVPLINYFPVGARNKEILRIIALRDSVIILKEDGIYRLNGDNTTSFQVTPLDTTVICVSASSVAVLNNQVLALTNQGVVLISDSSVQIISRKIEDPIQAVLGSPNLVAATSGCAYESDRLYLLTTLEPNGTAAGVTYLYNILNDTWTTSDALFQQGLVGPSDTLYLITASGVMAKERKNQSRIDYCGQNYAITVTSVASDGLSAVISSPLAVPEPGDVIVKSDVFSRILTVETPSVGVYSLTFGRKTNMVAADSLDIYSGYVSTIKTSPFHAGLVGRMKQFSQMQIHLRDPSVSRLGISISGAVFGGSDSVTWDSSLVSASGGWGFEPWGFFPWGLNDGINNTYGTQPAPIIRIYLPQQQQRNTYIQPVLQHVNAGEAINMQAICYAVRPYGERTTR